MATESDSVMIPMEQKGVTGTDHDISPDDLEMPDGKGRTPLLRAVVNKQFEKMKELLKAEANINARDDGGNGVLHHLVFHFSESQQTQVDQKEIEKMVDLLFSEDYADLLDVEPHGSAYKTPLELATSELENVNEFAVLNKIHKKLSDAVGHSPSRPKAAHVVDLVFMNSSEELREVLRRQENNDDNKSSKLSEIVNQKIGRYSLLFHAVDSENSSVVKVLLEFGADPWKEEIVLKELPLHRAAARGKVDILTMLLDKMVNSSNDNNLKEYSYSLIQKLLENGKVVDSLKCFHLLLDERLKLDVNRMDNNNKTPLWLAAEHRNEEMILALLQAGAFLGTTKKHEKGGHTIWDILPQGILPRAMNRLITQDTINENKEEDIMYKENYKLRLDYRFLLPAQQKSGSNQSELKTVMDMYDSGKHNDAIKHPLVKTLLHAKWSKAKLFHIIDLVMCFLFVVFLCVFVYCLKELEEMKPTLSMVTLENNYYASLHANIAIKQTITNVMMGLLMLGCVIMFMREIFQITSRGMRYLKNPDNFLDVLLPLLVVGLISTWVNFSRHLAAWVIIAACLQFTLTVGRVTYFTLYIKMLRRVFMNYLTLVPLFSLLIIGFSMSFILTRQYNNEYDYQNGNRSLWEMFPKTFAMSMGELDYSSLTEDFPTTVAAKISAIVVFFVFVFGIIIVTMNVMNGLAVINTKEVKDEAEFYKLISQLELIFVVEAFKQLLTRLSRCFSRDNNDNNQLLSRSNDAWYLKAEINKDPRRLLLNKRCLTNLDDDTTNSLRCSRLRCLEEKKAQERLKEEKEWKSREEEKSLKLEESIEQLKAMVINLANKLIPEKEAVLHPRH